MFKNKLTDEIRFGIALVLGLLLLPLLMFGMNYFLSGNNNSSFVENEKEKTVIITKSKQSENVDKPLSKAVVATVRDALKHGNYSTAYMEVKDMSKSSPEYEELSRQLADETQLRKAPGIRKENSISTSTPVRYFDESTPRDRLSNAIFLYFVDVSGTLFPRFCIQVASKRQLGIISFTISADNKKIDMVAAPLKFENTEKGVAEWFDVPLDKHIYEAVQTMIKAKKVTLIAVGTRDKDVRMVTNTEIEAFRNIISGFTALGGNLNYMEAGKQHSKK